MTANPDYTIVRNRLRAIIDRQDADRGRPLTAEEKLVNLATALGMEPDRLTSVARAALAQPTGNGK